MYPNSLRFFYFHAIALCKGENRTDECLEALDEFLALAPKDHDKVPACYYRKATYYFSKKVISNFMDSMNAGLEAEKQQLPCFLPYQFPLKDMMMKNYTYRKQAADGKTSCK